MSIGYEFARSILGSDGTEYICFCTEPLKLNSLGLIHGNNGIDVTWNHKKQQTTVSGFLWYNGVPSEWKVLKVVNEILGESEIEKYLDILGVKIKKEV